VGTIWDKLSRVVILLLFLAGLAMVFFWYLPLIQENERYRRRIMNLGAEIQAEERLARHLKIEHENLLKDPRTLERHVRERLGYARTNETVIRFETPMRRQ
jgi:cell division protein FtsB